MDIDVGWSFKGDCWEQTDTPTLLHGMAASLCACMHVASKVQYPCKLCPKLIGRNQCPELVIRIPTPQIRNSRNHRPVAEFLAAPSTQSMCNCL